MNVIELARAKGDDLKHLVYASSSSVYGGNTKLPFSVEDQVDNPVSLYAATKKSDELMSHSYSSTYGIPRDRSAFLHGLWPLGASGHVAVHLHAQDSRRGSIPVFNHGEMQRDFTYIDDIVAGVLAALDNPPPLEGDGVPHRVYNLGNNKSEPLMRFIGLIEEALGEGRDRLPAHAAG